MPKVNAARFSAVGVGDILSIFTAVVAAFYATARVNVSDIYASTVSLHVLDLIGSDYTAFGINCTAYLCNVSSDMYEYDTSTRLIRVQFIVQPSLEIATCLVYLSSCDDYELYLAGLLH